MRASELGGFRVEPESLVHCSVILSMFLLMVTKWLPAITEATDSLTD